MTLVLRFVDSITAGRTVRLDLNDGVWWRLRAESRFDPPPARRTRVSSSLADGARYPESTYDDRVLELRWELRCDNPDAAAEQLALLARELDRDDGNILEYQPPGLTYPVFYRTVRLGLDLAHMPAEPDWLSVEVNVPAEPFAYGLPEVLPTVTVYNDPDEGTTQNLNPFFETDAADWTATGGTIVRSTAQFHEGAASGLLTPDGVSASTVARSGLVAAAEGQRWRTSAWLRCAVARSVSLNLDWRTSGSVFISTTTQTISVAANTWTLFDVTGIAPATTGLVGLTVSMGSTPPGSNTLHIDVARLRRAGGPGGMCLDITDVKGDVEADTLITETGLAWYNSSVLFACRCRGTPDNVPFVLQAEAMTLGTDTTTPGNDTTASGSGNNYAQISFATSATLTPNRLSKVYWPAAPSTDARGTYRVLVRVKRSNNTDPVSVRLRAGPDGTGTAPAVATIVTALTTAWQVLDFDLVSIPYGADPVHFGPSGVQLPAKGIAVHLNASRDSGTCTLAVDNLLFVPADEQMVAVDAGNDSFGNGYILDSANDVMYPWVTSGSDEAVDSSADLVPLGGLPTLKPGVTNRVYVLQHFRGQMLPVGTTDLQITYWPRFLYLRGAS